MADPVIVPPVPSVRQGEPIDTSPGIDVLQRVFDRVKPEIKTQATPKSQTPPPETQPKEPEKTPPAPVTPPAKPEETPAAPEPEPVEKPADESHDVPSFLQQALRGEPSQPAAPAEEVFPEELPEFKNSDEAKARYRKWRGAYDDLKTELKTLRERPTLDSQQLQRMEMLEGRNRQMQELLTRMGVEQSMEFQQNVIRPMHQAWQEAARIVQQAGGDPNELAKAMSLNGKSQFEALDSILSEMPESAKNEINDALRTYRRYDDARKATLANAPAAMEGIRKREAERQYGELKKQREEMGTMFDTALARLKADKLEVLLRTDMPEGKWWNEQGDNIVKQARELYLENTDLNRVAMACILAPSVDAYRKLWLNSQKKIGQLEKVINQRIGSEPNLSENGGPGMGGTPDQQFKDDLNKPFTEVFLREFHRSQQQQRR